MDSSFVTRPPPAVAKTRALRDPVAVRGALDIDLVDSKTVTPDDRGQKDGRGGRQDNSHQDNPRHDNSRQDNSKDGEPRSEHAPHDLVANSDARQVILRERDVRAEEREHPDHALLRLRAYRPSVGDTALALGDDPHADFKA